MATVIINHPTNVQAPIGDTALFTVEATGESLTYIWQYRNKGGTSWMNSPLSTSTTTTLSVPVTETRDGMSYRCKITDAGGEIVFTDAAYLFVLRNGTLEYDTMVEIADAIRNKLGSTDTMLPSEMAALIESIMSPDVSVVTATAGNVLAGKVFVDANGNAVTGTMTNQGAVSTTVEAGETYTIPAGYHNGSGKVTSGANTGYQVKTGTITASGSAQSVSVNHGFGKTPVGAVLYKTGTTATSYIHKVEWINGSTTATSGSSTGTPTVSVSVSTSSITFSYTGSLNRFYFYGNYNYVIWG